ncbi:MAG: tetratricopeptide repeat protein, partial [Phycisphaerales bacterium]
HAPYRPPAPYRDRFKDPYDGEIAFVDDQISRLTGWLQSRGQYDRTLVVVVGDHGEAFGEHGEREHGILLYDTTMQVPMIFTWPGALPAGTVVPEGGRLIDVLPTVAALLGWDQPEDVDGASIASSCRTGRGQFLPAYGESMYPLVSFGWAPLRSLMTNQYKLIDAPAPELYDRRADQAEERNLAIELPDVTERLMAELSELRGSIEERAPGAVVLDADSLSKLNALGYVGTPVLPDDEPGKERRDPKDMMLVFRGMLRAGELIQSEQPAEAVRLLEPMVRLTPESDAVWGTLGEAYLRLGEHEKARHALLQSLRTARTNPGRLCQIGDTFRSQGDVAKAIEYYNKAIEASPDFGEAYARLGDVYLQQGDIVRARNFIVRQAEIAPDSPSALTNLGGLHHQAGSQGEALRLLRQALQYDPQFAPAHRMIWRVLMALGRDSEASQALHTARDLFPEEKEFVHVLVLMLVAGPRATPETVAEALAIVKECCPPDTTDPQHFDALACALAASGDFPRAAEAAAHAMNLAQQQGDAAFAAQLAQRVQLYQQGRMPVGGGGG